MKVPKDLDEGQFLLNTLLLPKNLPFEGSCLVQIPQLKLEDLDLADHERFPHLATDTFMRRVFYKESGVTLLELVEWIHGFNKSGLLNLLWMPQYHRSNINLIVIKQLLTMVHDRCLWLSVAIPITDMMIHQITLLLH